MKKLGEEISYSGIFNNVGMFKTLTSRASISKSPYKKVTMDLKLGNMKSALKIPTNL